MPDALIYEERVNALNGESGSGKSWIAMLTTVEVLAAGGHVIYIDLEDHAVSVVDRLRRLGATDGQILDNLTYINPSRAWNDRAEQRIRKMIAERNTVLVVIDSIGELMALEGCKPNDDDAVASLYRRIPRMLARLGPAVLIIDHVPKNNEATPLYGIGSQRKRAAIDGASYMVEQVKAFSADRPGLIKLTTAKDRNGNFATGSTAAMVEVLPEGPNRLVLKVKAPPDSGPEGLTPTIYMEKISRYLEALGSGESSRNALIDGAGLAKRGIGTRALDKLVELGHLSFRAEGQRHVYRLERPYRETLASTDNNDVAAF